MRMTAFHVAGIAVTVFIAWILLPKISIFDVAVIALTGFIIWFLLQDLARAQQIRTYVHQRCRCG
jgi:hypothetical protein